MLQENWKLLAEDMVSGQIMARGVDDQNVLSACLSVPRHLFVPDQLRNYAYADFPLPIGFGQTISQPYIVALMAELCSFGGDEKVLEIGTGSGYQTAILSLLAKEVYSVEIIPELSRSAQTLLEQGGYHNVTLKIADGHLGWPEQAPFDAIICSAAPAVVPHSLLQQLAVDGVLVAPVGTELQKLVKITRLEQGYHEEFVCHVAFVPMIRVN